MALMGNINGQPAASDMPMLVWNTELSRAARRWSKKCEMKYDSTIADGENLAYAMEKNADVVTGWFMKHEDFKFGPITDKSDKDVLQYTQLRLAGAESCLHGALYFTIQYRLFGRIQPNWVAMFTGVRNSRPGIRLSTTLVLLCAGILQSKSNLWDFICTVLID
ncbi:hypothetical protein AHF37_08837 [Paragonimus kellicotti]|nr:hypothetical protein AHF37_08837 [Paragonimus kellicotti]